MAWIGIREKKVYKLEIRINMLFALLMIPSSVVLLALTLQNRRI